LKDVYWTDVEAQIKTIFYQIVFAPLMDILRKATPQASRLSELQNSGGNLSALVEALRSGKVQYRDGVFSGTWNSWITRDLQAIGAKWDRRSGVWRLAVAETPETVRAEAAAFESRARAAHQALTDKLNEIESRLVGSIAEKGIDADDALRHIEKGFQSAAKALEVQPKLDSEHKKSLAKEYNRSLKLPIEDFSRQSIRDLRETVEDNAMEGYRFDTLIDQIRHRYGVTANKARFLARQETSLFMAQYRKQRFEQAGVRRYKWSTSHDERVRRSHRALDGQVFGYHQKAPASYFSTEQPCNPGEDFNCRCVDIPLLELDPAFA
jgi:SPP1 gp7 family putative phage head morphogenesis protein